MLAPAFSDPVLSSQAVFRAVMDAMARSGTIVAATNAAGGMAAPPPLGTTAAAVALTLLDYETPVWLDPTLAQSSELTAWFRFHTGAPMTRDPGEAAFAFVADPLTMPRLEEFRQGSMEYPDRATTIIVQVDRLAGDAGLRLRGPGIKDTSTLAVAPLPADFVDQLQANRARFPRGVDLIFATATSLAALPRSVHVTAEQA
jgi:alpha-D-ribose 1-methylphosphonate 5-triphosphate synthase subunit PhnH